MLVKIELSDPRVRVAVALADDRDPDGDGPCVGQLATTSQVARTSIVIKDPGTGAFAIANQPSDLSTLKLPVRGERPVVDVLGIRVR